MGSVNEDLDVVIIGAGLSGINSAYLLQTTIPDASYAILEARDVIGGTWSFWKYPGARSDSNASVFRFWWHHWPHDMGFADAELIQAYAEDATAAQGIDKHIQLRQRVGETRWSSAAQRWTLEVTDEASGTTRAVTARWVIHCSGYYSYNRPLEAVIPGLEQFGGEVVHPQFWTDAADVAGKRVVLIGSGATAITMLPHVAKTAAHVTMLQRSPSYVLALPRRDAATALLRRWLPLRLADTVDWYRQMVTENLFVQFVTRCTRAGRYVLRKQAQALLPPKVDVDVHFNPRYTPFEQRLCMAPDGDFFKALHRPNCDIVTDVIDTVTADGVRLRNSGQTLPADMIITATGLNVQVLTGRLPIVDGERVDISKRFTWRSTMVEGVPNLCLIIGYITSTWVPGADARFRTVLRVMQHMRAVEATSATPTLDAATRATLPQKPVMPNSSGYLVAARGRLPLSSGRYPWIIGTNWFYDAWCNLTGNVHTGMVYRGEDKKNV